ncbi:sulfite exporter TauE/SafE family protein [Cytophagaceae bacterium ABcell3]|nr:sulfite exporter TauE/SafE family protein [Cytophagaceae bacterium ABcell3]
MIQLISEADFVNLLLLYLAGTVGYIISTISGGGGALLLVPILNFLIGARITPPVLNLGNFIGKPARIFIFRNFIDWRITKYYVPPAIIGTLIGAWFLATVRLDWLQIIVGLFLISTIFQFRFGKKTRSFKMPLYWFAPIGMVFAILSTIVGAIGPVLNPFYLNAGIDKERLVVTKTVNSFLVSLTQVGSYAFFGILYGELWIMGVALGLGAVTGNILAKNLLGKMNNQAFRYWLIGVMFISGIIMIVRQLL